MAAVYWHSMRLASKVLGGIAFACAFVPNAGFAQHLEGCFVNGQRVADSVCSSAASSNPYVTGGETIISQAIKQLISRMLDPGPSPAQQARARSNALNADGVKAANQGDSNTALAKFLDAAKEDPTNAIAMANYYAIKAGDDSWSGDLDLQLSDFKQLLLYADRSNAVQLGSWAQQNIARLNQAIAYAKPYREFENYQNAARSAAANTSQGAAPEVKDAAAALRNTGDDSADFILDDSDASPAAKKKHPNGVGQQSLGDFAKETQSEDLKDGLAGKPKNQPSAKPKRKPIAVANVIPKECQFSSRNVVTGADFYQCIPEHKTMYCFEMHGRERKDVPCIVPIH